MDSEDIEAKMLDFTDSNPEKTLLIYQARSEAARAKLVTERIHIMDKYCLNE
jgi:hypothetical protein